MTPSLAELGFAAILGPAVLRAPAQPTAPIRPPLLDAVLAVLAGRPSVQSMG